MSHIEELKRQGAPVELINAELKAAEFEVLPENWEALDAFLRVSTQWRITSGANRLFYQGLDYSAVVPKLKLVHPLNTDDLFKKVQLIEQGALAELNQSE